MTKKRKIVLIIGLPVIIITSIISFAFTEDLFEVSKNLDIFTSLFKEINLYYVDDTKPGQLIKTASDAMLQSLDPYTEYYTENDIEDYKIITTGQYGGIGAAVREFGDKVIITEPYENSPAMKGGVKAGDVIVAVNGVTVKGKSSDEISKMMKGQSGSPVKLSVERPGQTKTIDFNLLREEIKVKDVPYYGMLDNGIGYIKLTGFTPTAAAEVKEAFQNLKADNCKSIILDLRDNPGGLLNQAVDIVNIFVEKGVDVAVTKGRAKDWTQAFKSVNNPLDLTIPLAVLVDRNSASASEIVSGSLQDLDRAVIVGQRTYGKGLVQQTKPLTYNAQLKVTVAKYYIPSGRCIQALDYTHRNEDGSVDHVPDSLITAFKTRNGRIVYDGAGILPDVQTEPQTMGDITYVLIAKNYIFDYVTQYVLKNPTLKGTARTFEITDADYNDFVSFLQGKDYSSYKTDSEEELENLKKSAEADKYFVDIQDEFNQLQKKLMDRKKNDLQKFKPEIKRMIEDEIVSRFYYLKGRIEASFKYDTDLQTAIGKLNSPTDMKSILTTIEKPKKPFNANKKF